MADRIEELRRRVQSDPASIAFAALAEEYRRAGQHDEAIATCKAGLRRHPAYLSAHVTLGRALIEVGRYEEARQELEHVLKVAPENLAAIRGLDEISHRRGVTGADHGAASRGQAGIGRQAPPDPRAPSSIDAVASIASIPTVADAVPTSGDPQRRGFGGGSSPTEAGRREPALDPRPAISLVSVDTTGGTGHVVTSASGTPMAGAASQHHGVSPDALNVATPTPVPPARIEPAAAIPLARAETVAPGETVAWDVPLPPTPAEAAVLEVQAPAPASDTEAAANPALSRLEAFLASILRARSEREPDGRSRS